MEADPPLWARALILGSGTGSAARQSLLQRVTNVQSSLAICTLSLRHNEALSQTLAIAEIHAERNEQSGELIYASRPSTTSS